MVLNFLAGDFWLLVVVLMAKNDKRLLDYGMFPSSLAYLKALIHPLPHGSCQSRNVRCPEAVKGFKCARLVLKHRLKHKLRGAGALIVLGGDFEAEFFADVLHGAVVGENLAEDAVQFFHASDGYELFQQFKTKAEILPFVADEQREFRLVQAVNFAQASDAKNFFLLGLGLLVLGDERDFPVVIIETDARQAFVRDALFQVQRAEVT